MTARSESIWVALRRQLASGLTAVQAFWPRFTAELAADRPIYLVAALYVVVANALALTLPGHPSIAYLLYATIWIRSGAAVILIFVLYRTLPAILSERPRHPLILLVDRAGAYLTPRTLAGLALVALQVVLMGTFTSVKDMLPQLSGYVWDARLADLDRALFGGHDPWIFVTPLLSRLHLLAPVEFLYATGWTLVVALMPAIVALAPALKPLRVRFFITYILCWALLGSLLALLGMSAGPAYFGEVTGDFARFQPLVDLVAIDSGSTWSAYDIQRALWDVYEHGLATFGTGISAFPSLHVAMATLWTIVGFRTSQRLGIAGLAFMTFVEIASVALGWHHAIDGFASMALVPLIWAAVGWALNRFASPQVETAPEC